MTTAQVRPKAHVGDVVATILIAIVALTFGIVLGGLFLVFTPMVPWWPVWTAAALGLIAAPIVTGIVGVVRLVKGRRGFVAPLIGVGIVLVLLVLVYLLGQSIQPVLPPA